MKESDIQKNIMKWSKQPSIRRKYPELKLLHHIPNGGKRSKREGAELKRQGVKAGVPDLCLPCPKGHYHGLYIELKTETGDVSMEQSWWIDELNNNGYYTKICRGFGEATTTLSDYLSLGE